MLKSTNSTRSAMKKIVPIVVKPGNLFGVLDITTAMAPVDIVHANHGQVKWAIRSLKSALSGGRASKSLSLP